MWTQSRIQIPVAQSVKAANTRPVPMLGASTSRERKYYLRGTDVKFADVLEGLLNVQDGEFVPLSHAAILAMMAAVTHVKVSDIWASEQENLIVACEQQRHRPACPSAQSYQRLCYWVM